MASEMVERVALADVDGADDWDLIGPVTRGIFERNARAAIEAMREPTEGMWKAANYKHYCYGDGMDDIYRTMIDEALRDA